MKVIDYIWLIPVLPLVAAGVQSLLRRPAKRLSMTLSIVAMTGSLLIALWAFVASFQKPAPTQREAAAGGAQHAETASHADEVATEHAAAAHDGKHATETHAIYREVRNFTWLTVGNHQVKLGFVNDSMTAMMLVMVTFVGLMIFIFSTGYMGEDENVTRFFCFLSLFAASMLGLVVANNLLLLFMCWELVGLCSYLLIGFWFFKDSAALAARKAFITTRIGDVGFLIGIIWLYAKSGTLLLYDNGAGILEDANVARLAGEGLSVFGIYMSVSSAIAICLFFGAMGKSAQFPLHVWLPDAMEGPTPVSALIHAATMVAAGVFLVGRMYPLFDSSIVDGVLQHGQQTPALSFVMIIGCITAVFTATIGVAQNDIKRVLAYSTCSQLGFMMMGLGALGFVAGMFHLITHAFFKALLFLGSGAVIHGCHHEQDMARMGGLKKYMPITFWTYLVGMLALVGFPLTAGFFSKDEILASVFSVNKLVWALGTFGAFLTAFYMTRQMFMVFAGEYRGAEQEHEHEHEKGHEKGHGHAHTPHEVPANMWMPLAALAFFALFLGWLGTPWIGGNLWHHYLAPGTDAHPVNYFVMGASVLVGLAGIAVGYLIYGKRAVLADGSDPLQAKLGGVWTLLKNKWYVDELYEATVVRLNWLLAAFFRLVDSGVDGVLHGIARVTWLISQLFRWVGDEFFLNGGTDLLSESVRGTGGEFSKVQSGRVQNYMRLVGWGTVALFVVLAILLLGTDLFAK
jgi:NADH-quinone oxidoreductase subunit L